MSKVVYSPKKKFSLFSVTKGFLDGWDIGGDRNAIWLRKNKQTIKFNFKINTKEGIIFAVYANQ